MAIIQELTANYDTIYQTGFGNNNVVVTVQPGSATPNTVQAQLLLQIGQKIVNNNVADEGDLVFVLKNSLKSINFELDENGNLIVDAPDANNYSLDDEGNLIYTYR
jgi:hypothetical protein